MTRHENRSDFFDVYAFSVMVVFVVVKWGEREKHGARKSLGVLMAFLHFSLSHFGYVCVVSVHLPSAI